MYSAALSPWKIVGQTGLFNLRMTTGQGEFTDVKNPQKFTL